MFKLIESQYFFELKYGQTFMAFKYKEKQKIAKKY